MRFVPVCCATNELVVEIGVCPRGRKTWLNLFRETSEDDALLRRREMKDPHPPDDWAVRTELLALKDDEDELWLSRNAARDAQLSSLKFASWRTSRLRAISVIQVHWLKVKVIRRRLYVRRG